MKPKKEKSLSTAHALAEECGSCYAATSVGLFGVNCCNTCEAVQEAYRAAGIELPEDLNTFEQCHREDWTSMIAEQSNEGCRLNGRFKVNKIPGNFHFAPGYSFQLNNMHAHDLRPFPPEMVFDFSHHIHYITFGEDNLQTRETPLTNPLKDYASSATGEQMYTYFIKVVPTEFHFKNRTRLLTHQYSSSEHHRDASKGGNAIAGNFVSGIATSRAQYFLFLYYQLYYYVFFRSIFQFGNQSYDGDLS
jgi:endoplasmic reticulum-Golgi intermediate compartment protein 3